MYLSDAGASGPRVGLLLVRGVVRLLRAGRL